MFARVKAVRSYGRTYQYVHLVENRRENGKVRQRIVGSLGRLDELLASGELQRIIQSLVAHCPQVKLVQAQREEALVTDADRVWGPVLVFERIWEELGFPELFRKLSAHRRFELGAALSRRQPAERVVCPWDAHLTLRKRGRGWGGGGNFTAGGALPA
jgi:hypothetical protein